MESLDVFEHVGLRGVERRVSRAMDALAFEDCVTGPFLIGCPLLTIRLTGWQGQWQCACSALFGVYSQLADMNPAKVVREKVRRFTDLPNIGPAAAKDFALLGFTEPSQLVGADPFELYRSLSILTKTRQDPCVLDVFMSVVSFLEGKPPAPWWSFTEQRKRQYGQLQTADSSVSLGE